MDSNNQAVWQWEDNDPFGNNAARVGRTKPVKVVRRINSKYLV